MKQFLFFIVFGFLLFSSCQQNKRPLLGETPFQKSLNATFKDASTSPLKKKDRQKFEGLDFFEVDSSYIVQATLKHTPDSEFFNMPTTTGESRQERVFGVLHFKLNNEMYQLNVYESKALVNDPKYTDYLFLPFSDLTNGESTYAGGRYIELRVPNKTKAQMVTIDFNTAFNPYCAYNDTYSCPIVPRDNTLNTKILAGVKAYNKH